VNARDNEGNSPLHDTFLTDVEEELLKLAANLNAHSKEQFQTALRRDWCFALDSAQHPAHRPVLCPWSELTLLANRLSDGPSCSP
jgi:hypothetical protein